MKTIIIFACVLGAVIVQGQGQEESSDYTESLCDCGESTYQPVCGDDGQTYSSVCEAKCSEQEPQCEGECPCPESPSDLPTRVQKVCPFYIRKVCGDNGNTFDNECQAENNGVSVQCEGECPCGENAEEEQEDCPFCCTSSSVECQGKRVDCSRCDRT